MEMKDVNKVDYTKERLNQWIVKSLEGGMRWKDAAERYDVPLKYIQSVHSTYILPKKKKSSSYLGQRMTDNKPSPVTTYNIHDLTPEQIKEKGIDESFFYSALTKKRCNVCNLIKDVSEFSPHSRTKDGFRKKCKQCSN